jgi:ABC-type sugar transport system ATPase subunit
MEQFKPGEQVFFMSGIKILEGTVEEVHSYSTKEKEKYTYNIQTETTTYLSVEDVFRSREELIAALDLGFPEMEGVEETVEEMGRAVEQVLVEIPKAWGEDIKRKWEAVNLEIRGLSKSGLITMNLWKAANRSKDFWENQFRMLLNENNKREKHFEGLLKDNEALAAKNLELKKQIENIETEKSILQQALENRPGNVSYGEKKILRPEEGGVDLPAGGDRFDA